jgi:hypothetical protein
MRPLGIIALCIAVLIVGAVIGYMSAYPTYSYRYRMTVEVMVDGAVRSGASVIEVKINKQPKFGQAPPQVSRVRGEAIFIDLGNGRNVVALLAAGAKAENVDYPYNVVPEVFGLTFDDRDLRKLADLNGSRDLPTNFLPTFVTFSDLNDLKIARIVSPYDFEKEFGPDVQFKRVWIEVTEDPVTRGIETKLSWLSHMERYRANPSNPFSNTLRFGRPLFVRENP